MNTYNTDKKNGKKNLKKNKITEKEEVNHYVTIKGVQEYIDAKYFQDVKLSELDNIEFNDEDFVDTVKTLAKYGLAKDTTCVIDENYKERLKARVYCWKNRQNISQDINNLKKGQRICYVMGENNNPNFKHITCIIVYKDNNGDVYEFDIGNSENKLLSCILNEQIKSSYRIYLQKSPFNCSVFACKAIKTLTPYAISNILQNKDKKDLNNEDVVLTDNHINQKYLPLKLLKYSEFGICDTIKNLEERFNYKDKNVQKIINQILVNAKKRKNKYVNNLASLFKYNKLQPKKYKTPIKQPDTGLNNITNSYNKLNQFV